MGLMKFFLKSKVLWMELYAERCGCILDWRNMLIVVYNWLTNFFHRCMGKSVSILPNPVMKRALKGFIILSAVLHRCIPDGKSWKVGCNFVKFSFISSENSLSKIQYFGAKPLCVN